MNHEKCLSTKFGLWIGTRSSIESSLHGNDSEIEQGIILQIEKASEAGGGDHMCYVFSLEDAVAHISVTNPNGILATEK